MSAAAADNFRAPFLQGYEQFKGAGQPVNPYISTSNNADAFNLGVFAASWNLPNTVSLKKSKGYIWIMGGEPYKVEGALVTKEGPDPLWSVAHCCPAGYTVLQFPATVQIQKDGNKVAEIAKPYGKQAQYWWEDAIWKAIAETMPERRCTGCGAMEKFVDSFCWDCCRPMPDDSRPWSHVHAENPPI